MLKTGLGRGLGDLMNGRNEPKKEANDSDLFGGSGKPAVSPGLGAYLRPEKPGPAAVSSSRPTASPEKAMEMPSPGLLVITLGLADASLMALCGCLLWNGPASAFAMAAAALSFLLAAWCGCLACWLVFAGGK